MCFSSPSSRSTTKHVLNFGRVSVGINKLQADPSALQELKAACLPFPASQEGAPHYTPSHFHQLH